MKKLQKMIEEEWLRNNTDLLSEDEDDTGLTVAPGDPNAGKR